MTEITDLSVTDSSNTSVSSFSTDGSLANMSTMDNVIQAMLGLLARSVRTNVLRFLDNTDDTKQVALDLSGLPTATTRTLSVPNASGKLVLLTTLVGTVSQTGGVPTGAVFEDGSNANGSYTKYADGTMICRHRMTANTTITAATGGVFRTGSTTWTFPAAFTSIPACSVSEDSGVGQSWGGLGTSPISTTSTSFAIFNGVSTAVPPIASLIAIGRWF